MKIKNMLTMYLPRTPYVWVYMLQQVEYEPAAFTSWFMRWPDYRRVMRRKRLIITGKAMLLLVFAYILWLAGILQVILLAVDNSFLAAFLTLLVIPLVVFIMLFLACWLGLILLTASRRKIIKTSAGRMSRTKAVKIAVLGSYGKTTMKELLATVLGQAKNAAATPGNNNIAISHARWVTNKLTGSEEVLIIEFGEYRPGDIANMSDMFKPDIAVITGIAPNHLENYHNYDELKADIASVGQYVEADNLFVPEATAQSLGLPSDKFTPFGDDKVLGWKISKVSSGLSGLNFSMQKGDKVLSLKSELLGEHLVGPLALTAALADKLGLTTEQIEEGVLKTTAFEHRMQPLNVSGAIVIDDTYNGNIEGMRAGLKLLAGIHAKRKIYVTPGLVEQGYQTESVHTELGVLIAEAKPDKVVLMDNSVSPIIQKSLIANGYNGELKIEPDPLRFYTNIQYEVAAGDVVLMQNDWTDNYF